MYAQLREHQQGAFLVFWQAMARQSVENHIYHAVPALVGLRLCHGLPSKCWAVKPSIKGERGTQAVLQRLWPQSYGTV